MKNKHQVAKPHATALAAMTLTGLLGLVGPQAVYAQQAPDAGRTLQQLQQPMPAPRESRAITIQAPAAQKNTLPGGMQVSVKSISLSGNTVLGDEVLSEALKQAMGQSLDLAGLRNLADRVTEVYREAGYPFARAILPPQTMADGVLRIEVIEGRYGKVLAQGEDAALASQAQNFLSRLQPGEVIESAQLERVSLILDDQPGVKTEPLLRPGAEVGSGDLVVGVSRAPRFNADVGLDNHGNRLSGAARVRANVNINSPFMLGDQVQINALLSEARLWLAGLSYNLPVGGSGMRANAGLSQTSYELGKEMASAKANGTARVASAGLSYPLLRSQKSNLTLAATYTHKKLNDNTDSTGTRDSKSSESLPVTLQFDRRDELGGGGIGYGSLTWTTGNLALSDALSAIDSKSGNNSRGRFTKVNVDLFRMQQLPGDFSLFAHLSGQWAAKNLDSSEGFGLGGATGVRAYPSGEGSGDAGWLAQIELRYQLGAFAPYAFVDKGSVTTDAKPSPTTVNNRRDLGGLGAGLRYQANAWTLDGVLAWRAQGGAPQSDTRGDAKPRVWVNVGYRF